MENVETLAAAALIYLAPACIAVLRSHKNTMAICTLNLLLGWTVLGWIGALVWSMTANIRTPEQQREFDREREEYGSGNAS